MPVSCNGRWGTHLGALRRLYRLEFAALRCIQRLRQDGFTTCQPRESCLAVRNLPQLFMRLDISWILPNALIAVFFCEKYTA